jgi:hypothetical protein
VVAAKHRRALTDRLAYMDVHATAQYDRVMKEGGTDEITTIYLAEGPPEKYQTTGRIDSTDWRTGRPRTNVNVIALTFRWSTAESTSPRSAPARRPTSLERRSRSLVNETRGK